LAYQLKDLLRVDGFYQCKFSFTAPDPKAIVHLKFRAPTPNRHTYTHTHRHTLSHTHMELMWHIRAVPRAKV
jgi:hypothetical protein